MPSIKLQKTKNIKNGSLAKFIIKTSGNPKELIGVILKPIVFKGSTNYFEILSGDAIHVVFSKDIEIIDTERFAKMERFNLNFKSLISSIDEGATIALDDDSILISATSTHTKEELLKMLPEEFEGFKVAVINTIL